MKRGLTTAAAGLLTLATPVHAQEGTQPSVPPIGPLQAKQCALWASYLSEEITDTQVQQALMFALNYFVGVYEGASGKSITDEPDEQALIAVASGMPEFSTLCGAQMEAFGSRMSAWGDQLTAMGEVLAARKAQ